MNFDPCFWAAIVGGIISLVGLVGWGLYAHVRRDQIARISAPMLYLVHFLAFATVRFAMGAGCHAELLDIWCSILRLHAVILIAFEGIFHVIRERVRERTLKRFVEEVVHE